jgi:hypothetical protein
MSSGQYWSDYTFFIKRVEELTGFSPSDLLELYDDVVMKLGGKDGSDLEAWINEDLFDIDFIGLIYLVIEDETLSGNILKTEFAESISHIEKQFEEFLLPEFKETDWKHGFNIEYIDWSKTSLK